MGICVPLLIAPINSLTIAGTEPLRVISQGRDRFRLAVPLFGRVSLLSVDQLVASLSNVVIAFAVANASGAHALGAYGLAFAVYVVSLNLMRASLSEPYLVTAHRAPGANSLMVGSTVLLCGAVTGITLMLGLFSDSMVLIALAVVSPLVLVQDSLRYVAIATNRSWVALISDCQWLLVSLGAAAYLIHSGADAQAAILGWGVGGGISAVTAAYLLRVPPTLDLQQCWQWWRRFARQLAGGLGIDVIAFSASSQVAIFAVAGFMGVSAVGVLRGGQILLTPAQLVVTATALTLLPVVASLEKWQTPSKALMVCLCMSIGSAMIAIPAALVAQFVSHEYFATDLHLPLSVLVPLALITVLNASGTAFAIFLKAIQAPEALVRARVYTVAVGLPVMVGAAAWFGIVAVAWSWVLQAAIYALVAGVQSTLILARSERTNRDDGIIR